MLKKIFLCLMLVCFAYAKDTLVVGIENESPRLNPFFDEDHDSALSLIFSGLFEYKDDKLVKNIAKDVKQDGLKYTISIRDDVYFHDGVKLGVDDVIFTLNMARDEKLNAEVRGNFIDIKDIYKVDDTTFVIELLNPYPSLLDVLSIGIVPKHILKSQTLEDFDKHPVGAGAYKFVEKKSGEYIKLVANENYHIQKPKIKNVVLKVIKDPNLVAYELENQKLDLAIVEPSFLNKLSKNKNLDYQIMPSNDYRALMINIEKFKDKNIRKALDIAICKENIVNGILKDKGKVAYNPIQNQFKADINYQKCDKEKSLQMFKDLGYIYDGKTLSKDGKPFSFDIYTFNFDLLRTQMAYFIKQELQSIGINVNVYAKDSGSFDIDKVDSFLIGWGSVFGADFYTYRVFSKEYDVSINENGLNYNHYNDENVSKYLKLARNTNDEVEKNNYYNEFLKALDENPPYIFLAYIDYVIMYNKNLKGIKNHTLGHHGNGFLYQIENFYFEK